MKKIGFIDLFIDEWHANNYPKWFREQSGGDGFEPGYAWEAENRGGKTLDVWCAEQGMIPARSLEEAVEKSDVLCVLAPSNPEAHETLAELPLKSGKPVYIDKPFAPGLAAAKRIFTAAEKYGTPLMSSSALRFGDEIRENAKLFQDSPATFVSVNGPGRSFGEYGIHLVEMTVLLLGTGHTEVRRIGGGDVVTLNVRYPDARNAFVNYHPRLPYSAAAANRDTAVSFRASSNIFQNLISEMLEFYRTGVSPIPKEQTLEVVSILEEGIAAIRP